MKIPLLQAMRDAHVYAKTIRELCIKKSRRKRKDPPTIQFIGQSTILISEKPIMEKYVDRRNLVVIVYINNIPIQNTLIGLGPAINIITVATMEILQRDNIRPTPIVLKLAYRSKIKHVGALDDIIVYVT